MSSPSYMVIVYLTFDLVELFLDENGVDAQRLVMLYEQIDRAQCFFFDTDPLSMDQCVLVVLFEFFTNFFFADEEEDIEREAERNLVRNRAMRAYEEALLYFGTRIVYDDEYENK